MNQESKFARAALFTTVVITGLFTIVASHGGTPPPPSTTGAISVSTGFGAVSSTPYQCTGSGTVTVTPQSLTGTTGNTQSQSQPYTYSGNSSTTPNEAACQQNVFFGNLATGTWRVTNGFGTCTATVVANQSATVKIWNGACS